MEGRKVRPRGLEGSESAPPGCAGMTEKRIF